MSTAITLEAIESAQTKVNAMIEAFKKQPPLPRYPLTIQPPNLKDGEIHVGIIISADGTRRHHLILLPGEAESKNWKEAMDWAASIGGELPDRVESALLFATMKSEFKEACYWTRELHVSGSLYAWGQYFDFGGQDYWITYTPLRARAVRRLEIL